MRLDAPSHQGWKSFLDTPVVDGQRDACRCSCGVCVRACGARWRLDHPVQRPDDSPHPKCAPCTQSAHQPCYAAQPSRGRSHVGDAVQLRLGRALGDRGRGGEGRGGATTAVATT